MPSLQNLPQELIERIAENLCLRCTPPPVCDCYEEFYAEAAARIAALATLCLTSRLLSTITTRHLYHHPDTNKWWLLTATLLQRPDLAQHVKHLHFPECFDRPEEEDEIPPSVLTYYHTSTRHAHAHSHSHSQSSSDAATPPPSPPDEDRLSELASILIDDVGSVDEDLACMLLSLCPCVETLDMRISSHRGSFDIFCSPGSLQCLHTAALTYSRTEDGFGLGVLAALSQAAPNLRKLRCWALSDDGRDGERKGLAWKDMREIECEMSALSAGGLRALLETCPALETFKFGAGGAVIGDEQFTPEEARRSMMAHQGRLKRVVVDYSDGLYDEDMGVWSKEQNEDVVRLLREKGIESEWVGVPERR